jgi:Lar family restriction alleviation protein
MRNCPFCGGIVVKAFDYPFKARRQVKGCYVYCDSCGARTGVFYTVSDAIKAWNERNGENAEAIYCRKPD